MSIFFVPLDCVVGVVDRVFGLEGQVFRFLPSASLSSLEEDEESAPAKSSEESEGLGPPAS